MTDLKQRLRRIATEHANQADLALRLIESELDFDDRVEAEVQARLSAAKSPAKKSRKSKTSEKRSDGHDTRVPYVGSTFSKRYHDEDHVVEVLAEGKLLYRGEQYGSVSAIAKEIVGRSTNGYDFFGLGTIYPEGGEVAQDETANEPSEYTRSQEAMADAAQALATAPTAPATPAKKNPLLG